MELIYLILNCYLLLENICFAYKRGQSWGWVSLWGNWLWRLTITIFRKGHRFDLFESGVQECTFTTGITNLPAKYCSLVLRCRLFSAKIQNCCEFELGLESDRRKANKFALGISCELLMMTFFRSMTLQKEICW